MALASKVLSTVLGIACVYFWLANATRHEGVPAPGEPPLLPRHLFIRRFWVLAVVVVAINATWHYFRAWLPLFLEEQHGYTSAQTGWFIMFYYIATDAGSLTAGFGVLLLARGGDVGAWQPDVGVRAVCGGHDAEPGGGGVAGGTFAPGGAAADWLRGTGSLSQLLLVHARN